MNQNLEWIDSRWSQVDELLSDSVHNREALFNYSERIHRLFQLQLMFASDGRPHALRTQLHEGTHPPYWTYFQHTVPDSHIRRRAPRSVIQEGQALIAQGIRIQQRFLGLFPELDRNLLFPLNLREVPHG